VLSFCDMANQVAQAADAQTPQPSTTPTPAAKEQRAETRQGSTQPGPRPFSLGTGASAGFKFGTAQGASSFGPAASPGARTEASKRASSLFQSKCEWVCPSCMAKNADKSPMCLYCGAKNTSAAAKEGSRELALAVVARYGHALRDISEEMKGNREVVLVAVAQRGTALQYASAELRGDREVVLAAVAQDGRVLEYASAELKGDKEVVLVAVTRSGFALEYASAELKGDREVVLAAVAQSTLALHYASAELHGDREAILAEAKLLRSLGSLGPKAAR